MNSAQTALCPVAVYQESLCCSALLISFNDQGHSEEQKKRRANHRSLASWVAYREKF